jgi:FAD/FMN-containing dehydrogenase
MPSRAASAVAAIERLARDAGCQPCFDVDPALAWIAVRLTPPEPLPERALAALHAAVAALPGQAHWRRLAPEAARDLAPLPVAPAARDLMARVKRALDPHGVFASGRFGRSTPSVRATEEP